MDTRRKAILDTLIQNPEGLGFRQLAKKLKNEMAPDTLRKQLNYLCQIRLISKKPDNPRKGQKIIFKLKESYTFYKDLIKSIEKETSKLIQFLDTIKNEKNIDINIIDGFSESMFRYYSIPSIVGQIATYRYEWENNEQLMRDILFICYKSYMELWGTFEKILLRDDLKKMRIEKASIIKNFIRNISYLEPEQFKIAYLLNYPFFNIEKKDIKNPS